ncbi:N-acetylmuramoyl-L-alanine amidase [Paractinoplanes rishiriensis]|uniref:N-acetylmuramoyl-L-alanine amidase n=1 Tax=Paractinoplanes rishiriensis TaxID=1050105 RepID=UPI00194104DA|nr:N-acetylmuramoyl-L-alanine amidase [Actinoplanes rishiriensis]
MAVLSAGGGVAVLAWPSTAPVARFAEGAGTVAPDPNPPKPAVRARLDVVDIAPADPSAAELDVPERDTKQFSLLGITWNDPKAAPAGTVQVRTRSARTGKWSGWRDLEAGEAGSDSEGGGRRRGATEPMWVGPSDGVSARIQAGGAAEPLPAGLRLDLVDPGRAGGRGGAEPDPAASDESPTPEISESSVPEPEPSDPEPPVVETTTPTTTPTTAAPTSIAPTTALPSPDSTAPLVTPLPAYTTRTQWSADETLVTDAITVAAEVKVIFVHHTAGSNDYACADSPAIVRAIQKYHVNSNGWSDIGYNFLVDKCGRLFEGRRGGVTKAVVGAHTYAFNTFSAGVAVLGDYTKAPSAAAFEMTVAQLAAARLGAYGHNPATSTQLKAGSAGRFASGETVTFPRISGHRDGVATECPGDNLYAQLPLVRARAVNVVSGLAAKPLTGGTLANGVFHVRTVATLNWSVTTPSANLSRFDLLLDGKVAGTAPGTARSAAVKVPAGAHTVAVRAVHVSGATGTTAAAKVFGDATAPTFPGAPAVVLRGGTYSATSVPLTVTFRAADNVKVSALAATSPRAAGLGATATSWATTVRPGPALNYTLAARDWAGNARTATVQRKAVLPAETAAKRSGTWTARSGSSYLGGKALAATKKNAKLTYTFTGRSAALLFSRGAKTGKADIYLDGKKVATVDTRLGSTKYRQALWVRALTPGKHTVAVVVAGTSGRPTVVADGLAYIG